MEVVMPPNQVNILINQRPFKFDRDTLSAQEIRDAVNAAATYEVWHIVKSPDPEGQLPVDDVQITSTVTVKSGDRFRVVPPGTFGGK
jgi:hypothetical protein